MFYLDRIATGSLLKLGLHSNSHGVMEEVVLFNGIIGEGDDRRAKFTDGNGLQWDAYRYSNRWAWGSSANRVQVLGVIYDAAQAAA